MNQRTYLVMLASSVLFASLIFIGFFGIRYLWVFTSPSGRAFLEAYQQLHDNHLEHPNAKMLLNGAVQGMVNQLDDPFTAYLPPFDDQGTPSLLVNGVGEVGIGIKAVHPNGTGSQIGTVRSISPAAEAGIRTNDFLIRINGIVTDTLATTTIAKKLVGARVA